MYRDAKRLLIEAGYAILELHINAATCGVGQVRRRVFVLAVRDCEPSLLQQAQREVTAYNRTPATARTVIPQCWINDGVKE